MEARRLAILCSHLRPIGLSWSPSLSSSSSQFLRFSNSGCSSGSGIEQGFRDSDNGNLQKDCVFCNIIRGESPAFKLYEDDMCLCILDTNPLSHGHSLIIPKSHFSSLEATPPSVVAAMCSKVPFISSAILKSTGCDSFNLLVNNGTAAGQVIFHTHIHIIPRKAHDCLWASESLRRHPLNLDEAAFQLVSHVKELLSLSDVSKHSKTEDCCPSKD
ncbi:Histidine triad nucleotide-binding protein [Quillaja saponaria]|uniref:Histidine triad nucleotide-binding protein n=1 Tax=Quillaja saponaria TaxID=32244 RepID=A0AAD7LNX1_QUISA|nr:Histidine triad nucleotide-binding protein [Quillaja saponaria]